MDLDLRITDMLGATPEHSIVITNFVATVYPQLKDSTCRVFPDNVQYKWKLNDGSEKTVIPDASINCQVRKRRGNSFLNAPQFILEVLSPSTEKYDRTEKMNLYCEQEISEYWIIDFRKKEIEIYELDYDGDKPKYYLTETVTGENSNVLYLRQFPHIKIDFEQLFDGI